jgi:hypothetical protein
MTRIDETARDAIARLGHVSVRFYDGIAPQVGSRTITLAALKRLCRAGEIHGETFTARDGSRWAWFMPADRFVLPPWAHERGEPIA